MAVRTIAEQSAWLKGKARTFRKYLQEHEKERTEFLTEYMQVQALLLTDGTISTKQLRAMGHPYRRTQYKDVAIRADIMHGNTVVRKNVAGNATRRVAIRQRLTDNQKALRRAVHPSGTLKTLPINVQSGDLQRGLKVYGKKSGGWVELHIKDPVPYAVFQLGKDGTKRMKPRGFMVELRNKHRQVEGYIRLRPRRP